MRRRWLGRPVGSSPHTRGTRYCTNNECETFRFIPAYAGNEQTVRVARLTWPVHPRIRGERSHSFILAVAGSSSSPHTRGTIPACPENFGHLRFIPAYAGNDSCAPSSVNAITVHPRIRGERPRASSTANFIFGSSPHTRGTQWRRSVTYLRLRFIPAYAGNAYRQKSGSGSSTVHPRIRGERGAFQALNGGVIGSSPHTRGTHFQ